ncbi:MAG: adenylate/guanylate cyclase domain-containing protein [Leptospiraceae bacterium]|nr:adenylate/guanylate cyclase domain-containing protein [Leptospiraceae bacterium]
MDDNRQKVSLFYSVGFRHTVISVLSVLLLASGLTAYDYFRQEQTVIRFARGALEFLVVAGAYSIRGEDVLKLNVPEDYQTEEYARLYNTLSYLYLKNRSRNIRVNSIYVLKPSPSGDMTIFAAHLPGVSDAPHYLGTIENMADERVNYIGDAYLYTDVMRSILNGELDYGSTDVYVDEHGTWVSAYAPIFTGDGRRVALLEADYDISFISHQIRGQIVGIIISIVIAAIFFILISVYLSRRISRPLTQLVAGLDRVAEGDFDARLHFNRRDEFGLLGRHFNQMVRGLGEKANLSRYVSSETVRKIEASDLSTTTAHSDRHQVCVFFSDIRGFTAYSEKHNVEHVVDVLNRILELQSALITRHGGEIDKFVGDEIMAIFKEPGSLPAALDAGLAIQKEARGLLEAEGLGIGIGVNFGEVIRGDIGSYFRKDYTVIGQPVNLASRLCSVARAGQVLITEKCYHHFGGDFDGHVIGRARFKGISELLRVYNITGRD